MKKIIILIICLAGFLFSQSERGVIDGQRVMQNRVLDNLSRGGDAGLNLATLLSLSDITYVNKFGRAPDGLQDVTTDIWDLANTTPTQSVWLAPTAARIHAVVSGSANDAAAAGIMTISGGNVSDGKIVTIGSKVYTFQATLSNVDGNVHIGGSESATIDNLIDAINLGAGAGTDYATDMTANEVTTLATVEGGDLMNIYMDTADGTLVTTSNDGNISWGNTTIVLGVGARTIRIYGLTSWDSTETSEVMYLQGVFPQNTDNSYVIIHRMEVLTKGGTSVNSGEIKATAASDNTITAIILAGQGQTQMAIYGVPSTQTAYMTGYYASFNKAGGLTVFATTFLLVNPEPQNEPVNFLVKHTLGIQSNGTSYFKHEWYPYKAIPGPAIIKLNAVASSDDLDGSGGFDLILVDN